jgi:hypothetical protein
VILDSDCRENMTEEKYYCRICGTEIEKERFEEHDELCDFCEQNEEDDEDEDFGIAPHY